MSGNDELERLRALGEAQLSDAQRADRADRLGEIQGIVLRVRVCERCWNETIENVPAHDIEQLRMQKLESAMQCVKCGAEKIKPAYEIDSFMRTDDLLDDEAPSHDFELEPTDDTIAALQHAVAVNREKLQERGGRGFKPSHARRQILACLVANFEPGRASYRPTSSEWLEVARLATQAYEQEKLLEEQG